MVEPEKGVEQKRKVARELRSAERRRRKRIILLLLLLLLILLLGGLGYYLREKELPLPSIEIAETERVLPPEFLFFFDGSPDHRMNRPTDVKVNPVNRLVYVTDTFNQRVSVFDEDGNFQFSFGDAGGTPLERPLYIAFDPDGNVWITERRNQKIFVFTPEGEFIKEFVPRNVDRNNWQPNAIYIEKDGTIYVSEIELNHHIQVFNPDGSLKLDFGESGAPDPVTQGPGLFNFPNGIVVDDRFIYITDSTNRRLQIFDKTGEFVQLVVTGGQPRGIDIGYQDRLHIVDAVGHNVLVYDKQGNLLTQFGKVGADRGQFFYPNGLGCDGRRIYIADTWNHRVDVWAWRPTVTTPPVARGVPGWIWFGLIPLFLIPFLFRRPRNVATRDFIERAIKEEKLGVVKKELKKLFVVESIYRDYADKEFEDIKMEDLLVQADYREKYFDEIKELDPEMDDETAASLALARHKRRRKRFFTESDELRAFADEYKIKTYNFEEFLDAFGYSLEKEEEK